MPQPGDYIASTDFSAVLDPQLKRLGLQSSRIQDYFTEFDTARDMFTPNETLRFIYPVDSEFKNLRSRISGEDAVSAGVQSPTLGNKQLFYTIMADKDDRQRLVPDWQFTDDHEYVAQELLESVGPEELVRPTDRTPNNPTGVIRHRNIHEYLAGFILEHRRYSVSGMAKFCFPCGSPYEPVPLQDPATVLYSSTDQMEEEVQLVILEVHFLLLSFLAGSRQEHVPYERGQEGGGEKCKDSSPEYFCSKDDLQIADIRHLLKTCKRSDYSGNLTTIDYYTNTSSLGMKVCCRGSCHGRLLLSFIPSQRN